MKKKVLSVLLLCVMGLFVACSSNEDESKTKKTSCACGCVENCACAPGCICECNG